MNFFRKGSKKSFVQAVHIVCEKNKVPSQLERTNDDYNNLHQPETKEKSQHGSNFEITTQQLVHLQEENRQLFEAKCIAEDKANYFENLLNEKESEILTLSSQVETLVVKMNEFESEKWKNDYQTKLKHVADLEQELQITKDESRRKLEHVQRKIKKLKEINAKLKQEYALEMFLLKDEKKMLREENETLKGQLYQVESKSCSNCLKYCKDSTFSMEKEKQHTIGNDSQNKLVVQLSQQVSFLDSRNQELKKELHKTHVLLKSLTCHKKSLNTKSMNMHEHQELCITMANLDLVGEKGTDIELLG